jgi:hypothetical protein
MNSSRIVSAVEEVLHQGKALLAELEPHTYATPIARPYNASIGGHYRHVLDHFVCLLAGLAAGNVDYDARSRSKVIETDIDEARLLTDELLAAIREVPSSMWLRPCAVTYSVGYSDPLPQSLGSTFARELGFSVGHAIHHYAIIRLLCAQWSVEVPGAFGVAPSTLNHQASHLAS